MRELIVVLIACELSGCQLLMGDLPPNRRVTPDSEENASHRRDAGLQSDSSQADAADGDGAFDATAVEPVDDAGSDARQADVMDAAPAMCDGGGPVMVYRDRDLDGHGDAEAAIVICAETLSAGWVDSDADCDDTNVAVRPDQTEYFGVGYRSSASPTGVSFDYNCDGSEVGAPGQSHARNCAELVLLGLGCDGAGYAVDPARTAASVNPYCGSNIVATCKGTGLVECAAEASTSEARYRCN